MRTLRRAIHDLWCLVTDRCQILHDPDPLLNELKVHEKAAIREAGRIRQRRIERQNFMEREFLGRGGR